MRAVWAVAMLVMPLYVSATLFSNLFTPDSIMGTAPARPPPRDTPGGFSDQTGYVSLGAVGALVEVGDFNLDRFVDLVMLNTKTLKDVSILFWDHEAFRFQHKGSGISLGRIEEREKEKEITPMSNIRGVHVGDFDNDGALDLLLHDGKQGRVFMGDGGGGFNETSYLILDQLPLEHALIDANADLVPDLFVELKNGTRGFWVFEQGGAKWYEWKGGRTKSDDGKPCLVADYASIAFVDMDGDCLPDLVVPTFCGLEVWSNPADSGRKFWELDANRDGDVRMLNDVFNANHADRSLAFADFNADGTIDIAVSNRNRQDLLIYLNGQKKRASYDLCRKDPEWSLEKRTGISTGLNLKTGKVGGWLSSVEIPAVLHVGDYDLDGMPDILAIDGGSSRPVLFRNEGRWKEKRLQEAHFKRLGKKEQAGLSGGNSGAVTGMFFDMDESGRQDILIVRGGNETRLVWNNMQEDTDSLFFKGTILSGLPYRQDPRPFAPVTGSTIKLSYMERTSRDRVVRMCSQCSQSGHWQLRVCNCEFGLMQIANYIEELWVGAGAGRRSWMNLMPNSMAVVWAEKGADAQDSSAWWMEYFTQRRGSQMLRVSAILVLALAVLGVAILALQHQERKQDREEEERERARLFNFV